MSHISGLPDYDSVEPELFQNEGRLFKRKQFSNAAYVDFISQLPAKGTPEQQFYYSNFSYHLLAIILEDVYKKYLQRGGEPVNVMPNKPV